MNKMLSLRELMQRSQMNEQSMQANQQEMQIKQQQLTDQQAMTAAMKDWDGKDYDALSKAVLQHGGSANAATSIQQHGLGIKKTVSDMAKQDSETGSKNLETFIKAHATIGDMLTGIEKVPDDQLHQKAIDTVNQMAQMELTPGQPLLAPQQAQQFIQGIQTVQDPAQLRQQIDIFAKSSQGAKATAEQEQATATARKTNAEAASKEAETKFYDNNPAAGAPGVPVETAQMADYLKRVPGATPGKFPAWKAAEEERLTAPTKIAIARAEAAARQAVADGDPKAAAQLLVSRAIAPSQITSARKPEFAQQVFSEAQRIQPGWNAQKAEADYKVASSPTNVAFFGSAKSLTNKGGTLDQLADAGKDIPDNQFPVFNSLADALRASTGSGPIAKYASIAIGVADDYSKVMGGGQGSDTSRDQALKLVTAKQSPEQRDASIEGIRGAVRSQINSRIGNNDVLQKMYGGDSEAPAPGGRTQAVTKTYQGKTYVQQPDGSWKRQ